MNMRPDDQQTAWQALRTMVGRELRMIGLKEEANAFCAQTGLPPRYPRDPGEARP